MKVKERPQAFHAHSTMMWASDYCQTVSALQTQENEGCVHGSQPYVQQTRFACRNQQCQLHTSTQGIYSKYLHEEYCMAGFMVFLHIVELT
jgi:hypothetical protein